MMFHRRSGTLDAELAAMNECMPHYYRITQGHGQGAELHMNAEAAFMQGNFSDAQILLEQTYSTIASNGQHNISLCCDFLAARLSLFQEGVTFVKNPEVKRKEPLSLHIQIQTAAAYAMLGKHHDARQLLQKAL